MSQEPSPLSKREIEIVRLVATGASNQQIARELYISVNTVKVHLRNIFAKLELNSRTELAMYAVQRGWVAVESARPAEETEEEKEAPEPVGAEQAAPPPGRRRWQPLVIAAGGLLVLILLAVPVLSGFIPLWATLNTPAPASTGLGGTMTALPTRWRERAPLPQPRTGLALVLHEGKLYAIGGETASGVVGTTSRYDPETDTWAERAPKPTPVTDVRAALLGGRIFVPGGRLAGGQPGQQVEVYDPESDTWATVAPLPAPRSAYALTTFEGQLYLFGGWDGRRFVATTYTYDPTRDAWTTRTPMPTARGYAGAAVANGKIFVVGGYDGQQDLAVNEEYAPSKDNGGPATPWTVRAPLPAGRAGAGVIAVANLIHVIGGGWTTGQSACLKYNSRNDQWEEFETPTTGIWRNMGVEVAETRIYCVGGWDGTQPIANNREYLALYVIIIPIAGTPETNP